MRSLVSDAVIAMLIPLAGGCSRKPPPDVDKAVRSRLTRYSNAWRQGDAAGVRESFSADDADEAALVDALADLAPAQAALRTAYHEALGPVGRALFGDDPDGFVIGAGKWN